MLALLISWVYKIWSATWRLEIIEDPQFTEALTKGPLAFAFWHGDEMVVLKLGPRYRCAAMTSTSKDGELMTQILKRFGFGISRGSSTRGGARALLGMVKLLLTGYNATVAVDGPKGPRHKPKPGILFLSQRANVPIVPTGVAKKRALIFSKSWNKTYLPWPFSKVIVSFGTPYHVTSLATPEEELKELSLLETKLHLQRGDAQARLLAIR